MNLDERLNYWIEGFARSCGVPAPDKDGWIPTKNGNGWMSTKLDVYSKRWVEYAATCGGLAMDIGCAYGLATLHALNRGANVFATDVSSQHLQVLRKQVPEDQLPRLKTRAASFPDKLRVRQGSVKAVLASRVFHFFDGETVEAAVNAIWNMLAPGGMVFVVCDSPYLASMGDFPSQYENLRGGGADWPGFCDNMWERDPSKRSYHPNSANLLCPHVLARTFSKRGFILHEAAFFARGEHDGFPASLVSDGREGAAYVGQKPLNVFG